jgi:Pyruvate/2-oxoacid:ferredoxin oxidoreductase delta subunit
LTLDRPSFWVFAVYILLQAVATSMLRAHVEGQLKVFMYGIAQIQFDYCHLKFFDCIMKCPNQKINMQHRMTVVMIKMCNGSRVATDAKRG